MNTSIRYVLRHALRGGGKTILAILLALLLTAAVGRLDRLFPAASSSVVQFWAVSPSIGQKSWRGRRK